MIKDAQINKILFDLRETHSLTEKQIEDIVESSYSFIRKTIIEIPYHESDVEDFDKIKKAFNMPGLCKFYPSKTVYKKIKNEGREKTINDSNV